jgi:hypothetical protein
MGWRTLDRSGEPKIGVLAHGIVAKSAFILPEWRRLSTPMSPSSFFSVDFKPDER